MAGKTRKKAKKKQPKKSKKNKLIKLATNKRFLHKKYKKPSKIARQFPLYDELLKLSRKGLPTLLYGRDSYHRDRLIGKIHSSNGGDSWCYEYGGSEEKFKDSEILCDEMEKAIKRRNHKRIYELLRDYRDTKRTFRRFDCGNKDSGTVFKELTEKTTFEEGKMMNHISSLNINRPKGFEACFNINPEPPKIFPPHHYEDCGALLRRGVLFIDNLRCNPNNPKDWDWYDKLARHIEKRRIDDPIYGGWLVAYADDLETFPKSLINQFEPISLDSKVYEEKQQEEKNVQTKERKTQTNTSQEIISVETTLFYDKTTGKFRFGNKESTAISKASRAKVRNIAEKLMKWWKSGKPCPHDEIVKSQPPTYPLTQDVYDPISKIRNTLKPLRVNMPQSAAGGYAPPEEPEHFDIITKS